MPIGGDSAVARNCLVCCCSPLLHFVLVLATHCCSGLTRSHVSHNHQEMCLGFHLDYDTRGFTSVRTVGTHRRRLYGIDIQTHSKKTPQLQPEVSGAAIPPVGPDITIKASLWGQHPSNSWQSTGKLWILTQGWQITIFACVWNKMFCVWGPAQASTSEWWEMCRVHICLCYPSIMSQDDLSCYQPISLKSSMNWPKSSLRELPSIMSHHAAVLCCAVLCPIMSFNFNFQ